MAGFTDHVRHEVNQLLGTSYEHEDLTEWELYDALKLETWVRDAVDAAIRSPGFCIGLPEIDGARHGVDILRSSGHQVVCLTTPFSKTDYWHAERVKWLNRHMGFKAKEVEFVAHKEHYHGDVLVEDKVDNLLLWEAEGKRLGLTRIGVLFSQPWNDNDQRWTGLRARNWPYVCHEIGVLPLKLAQDKKDEEIKAINKERVRLAQLRSEIEAEIRRQKPFLGDA